MSCIRRHFSAEQKGPVRPAASVKEEGRLRPRLWVEQAERAFVIFPRPGMTRGRERFCIGPLVRLLYARYAERRS
jgi:hypothetical protein